MKVLEFFDVMYGCSRMSSSCAKRLMSHIEAIVGNSQPLPSSECNFVQRRSIKGLTLERRGRTRYKTDQRRL